MEPFMYDECQEKQNRVKKYFAECKDENAKYEKLIEIGRKQPLLMPQFKVPENLVKGCQSEVYLHSYMQEGKVIFEAESDALISSGLAAILVMVFSGETPETILKCPPTYLKDIGISDSLTPNRASGLYSIHLRMQQEALKFLMQQLR